MLIKTCTFSRREGDQFSFWPLQSYSGLTKTAQLEVSEKLHPRIQDFVRAFKPTKHGVYVLVNAMGASEYWGSNANGDAFPEKALIHAPSDWDKLSPEEMKRVGKTWDYGFPTFMNAHVFTHHQNKDPAHSIGEVVLAVWNPKMHRVELILYIDRSACIREGALHVIERIERGEFPDVSMGCKVPYDVCLICGNKSKTRADYCEHAARMMNKILGDGRKIAVRNDFPKFFDISVVFVGADKTAKVMAKLAEVGDRNCLGTSCFIKSATSRPAPVLVKTAGSPCPCEKLNCSNCCVAGVEKYAERIFGVKSAAQRKLSEIIKDIPAGPFTKKTLPTLEQGERDIPNDVLDLMGGLGADRALATPSMMGMVLKPHEFQRVILVCCSRKPDADRLDQGHQVFQPGGEDNIRVPMEPGFVDDRLQELLSLLGLFRDRSAATPLLHKRVMMGVRKPEGRESAHQIKTQDEPLMKKLAALYNGYRAALLKKATDIERHLVSDPQLRAELFDSSLAQAFARGIEKTATTSVLGPESLAYLIGAHYDHRDYHTRSGEVLSSLAQSGIMQEAAA